MRQQSLVGSENKVSKSTAFNRAEFDISISRFNVLILGLTVALSCFCILMFPTSSANGVKKGLLMSSEILIPSLFPFMVLSSFVVKSSLAAKAGRFLDSATQFLFKLPGCTGATILLGLIGGYPTGARGINDLAKRGEITHDEAERMLCFVVGAGPAFVISVVGIGLFGSCQIGIILFLSQVLSSILIGIILGIFTKDTLPKRRKQTKKNSVIEISSALVSACADSTTGMINMCAFVVLFSAAISIMNECGISRAFADSLIGMGMPLNLSDSILPIFLEVAGGCSDAVKIGSSIELISFALGWAGICVHFQIYAILENLSVSKLKFMFFRCVHGLVSALFTHVGLIFFPQARTVMSTISSKVVMAASTRTEGSVALILLCVCFLFSLSYQEY